MKNLLYDIVLSIFLLNTIPVHGFGFRRLGIDFRSRLKHWDVKKTARINDDDIKTIEQPLDHFNPNDSRKWQMRYYEDLEYFKKDGPIFISIGGESDAEWDWMLISVLLMYDIAVETNGAIYGSEHRYFGESVPLNLSVTENLKYLSSRQALADLAHLIDSIKAKPEFLNSKVVVVGGSYAGNLAAWMRLLYPHKVDAAVASSAPVLAKKDFYQYFEKVAEDYKKYGVEGCYDKISETFNRYNKLLSDADGIKQLKKEENICEHTDMTKPENKELFFEVKLDDYAGNAQGGGVKYITDHCSEIMKNDSTVPEKQGNCLNYNFSDNIAEYRKRPQYIAWLYQTCTEFGYYQTTASSNKHPFTNSLPLEYYIKMCAAMYGSEFDEKRIDGGVAKSNELYGGLHPNMTNVIFVNGDVDPWSELGVLKDLSPEAPARVVGGATHGDDMFSESREDSPELADVKKFVKQTIKKWLKV